MSRNGNYKPSYNFVEVISRKQIKDLKKAIKILRYMSEQEKKLNKIGIIIKLKLKK